MAKTSVHSKASNLVKATRSLSNNKAKDVKSSKTSAKKVTKTKPVKKVAAKVTKAKTVKKSVKATKLTKAPKVSKNSKKPKAAKKKAQNTGPKGYTADQYQKFLSQKKRLQGKSNQELKDELRKNKQSMSGNKDELIYKVADGIVLGRIPRCPKCFGGRPKFDFKKGTYYCSGYRDDEDFKNCHSTFQLSEIKRQAWQ